MGNNNNARMAELVDALVSNTSELTLVPVRPRLRVLFENGNPCKLRLYEGFLFLRGQYWGHIKLI